MGLIVERNFCFDVNGRFRPMWCVALSLSMPWHLTLTGRRTVWQDNRKIETGGGRSKGLLLSGKESSGILRIIGNFESKWRDGVLIIFKTRNPHRTSEPHWHGSICHLKLLDDTTRLYPSATLGNRVPSRQKHLPPRPQAREHPALLAWRRQSSD